MGFFKTYLRLSPQARMIFGGGVIIWGGLGLLWSSSMESEIPAPKAHHRELNRMVPTFTVFDRGSSLPPEAMAEARMKRRLQQLAEKKQ